MANEKYRLTDETIEWKGRTLYRIEATENFADVQVGQLGGFVQSRNNLVDLNGGTAWIYGNAKAYDNAVVRSNGKMYVNAEICDDSIVDVDGEMTDNAKLSKKATYGGGTFSGSGEITDTMDVRATVFGTGTIASQKYKLTEEKIEWNGKTLYRIQALKDFGNVIAGQLGGFIESESNLSQFGNCWLYASVVTITGTSIVEGNVVISNFVVLLDSNNISGETKITVEGSNPGYVSNACITGELTISAVSISSSI